MEHYLGTLCRRATRDYNEQFVTRCCPQVIYINVWVLQVAIPLFPILRPHKSVVSLQHRLTELSECFPGYKLYRVDLDRILSRLA